MPSLRTTIALAAILAGAALAAGPMTGAAQAAEVPETGSGPGCDVLALGDASEGVQLIARGSWAGGTETTEYYGPGEYRITRCDQAGVLVERQEVETVEIRGRERPVLGGRLYPDPRAPAPAPGEQPILRGEFMTYPDPGGTTPAEWRRAGAGVVAPTPSPEAELLTDHEGLGTGGRCSTPAFSRLWRLNTNAGYEIHMRSLPHGRKTRRRIILGHQAWNAGRNRCGLDARSSLRMPFRGGSRNRVRRGDGKDTVDFGRIERVGCTPPALACAIPGWGWISAAGVYIPGEVDIRFARHYRWWSRPRKPPRRSYDVQSVAAHEVGHKIGLGHVSEGTRQTMCVPCGMPGTRYRRVLGSGDLRGLRSLYAGLDLHRDLRY